MDVHFQLVEPAEDFAAHLGRDLGGLQREVLVRPLGLDLEGFGVKEVVFHIIADVFEDIVHVLLEDNRPGDGRDAEDMPQRLNRPVEVVKLALLRVDVYGRLHTADPDFAEIPEPPFDVAHQYLFKPPPVEALERDFAVFCEDNLFHLS